MNVPIGARVRIKGVSAYMPSGEATGMVIERARVDGYLVVKLDQPARFHEYGNVFSTGSIVVEPEGNLEILPE